MSCTVSPNQEAVSAVPGNIGIIKAKVLVWENDPMMGRPFQNTTMYFSQEGINQLSGLPLHGDFVLNSFILRPIYDPHDMWIATYNPNTGKLDFVSCPEGAHRLPGSQTTDAQDSYYELNGSPDRYGKSDDTTGKDIFPHQIWLHVGNLFDRTVLIHPSEYNLPLSSIKAAGVLVPSKTGVTWFSKYTLGELQSAPKWFYTNKVDNTKTIFRPAMISKKTPSNTNHVHWSLEKLTPIWQGQDFFVDVHIGDQTTDDAVDNNPNADRVDTNIEQYKYLLYNPIQPPVTSGLASVLDRVAWVPGISNEAFYIPPKFDNISTEASAFKEPDFTDARKEFWWKYKSYLLVEIGFSDFKHNYFIEFVKGRKPRFLHLGEEWDNTHRLDGTALVAEDFKFIKKCRVLSEYEAVSTSELFKKSNFRFTVRNHLGRLAIIFEGYEDRPWIINRFDNTPYKYDFSQDLIPMVVPAGKMRIHGGNISCSIGYSPLRYASTTQVVFEDMQADTKEITDKELYITFAHMGNSEQNRKTAIKKKYFNDPKFGLRKFGYDIDAYQTREIHKNAIKTVPIYTIFDNQYKKYGKGWAFRTITEDTERGTPKQTILSDGFANGGSPHEAIIFNGRVPGKKFEFGLKERTDDGYPYKDSVSKWDVGVRLNAGSVVLETVQDSFAADIAAGNKTFKNYITPIVPSWNLIILGGAKPFEGKVEPFDIAGLVINMNDSWSTEGFTCIRHETKIKCYIPDSVLPVSANSDAQIDKNLHSLGQKVLSLHNKSFYVTIGYWWENGVGGRDAPGNLIPRTGPPSESDLLIQMTGIAYGAQLEKSVNKLFMEFTVKDYSSILDKQFIFNSPFFDGVSDVLSVYELARLAGFDDSSEKAPGISRLPLGFLTKVLTDPNIGKKPNFKYNGEECIYRAYDLPGSYSELNNPATRFQNGETYWSAMTKIAQLAAKVVYFDRWGVLRLENSPAIEAAFNTGEKQRFQPKFEFVTSPFPFKAAGGGTLSEEHFVFDPNKHVNHLVWEVVRYSRSVEDCINQIVLFTASNDELLPDGRTVGGFIIEGYTFFEQIFDPSAEGFFGFRKPFYQSNGVFGGSQGVRLGLQHYAKMRYPPSTIGFQTFSIPGLKPLDIVSLDDNLFYITEISHDIDPSANRAYMNISAEWLKPQEGTLGFLREKGPTDSNIPSST